MEQPAPAARPARPPPHRSARRSATTSTPSACARAAPSPIWTVRRRSGRCSTGLPVEADDGEAPRRIGMGGDEVAHGGGVQRRDAAFGFGENARPPVPGAESRGIGERPAQQRPVLIAEGREAVGPKASRSSPSVSSRARSMPSIDVPLIGPPQCQHRALLYSPTSVATRALPIRERARVADVAREGKTP